MHDQKILRNSARCLECGEHIVSEHRHHIVRCRCGHLAVDGGLEYTRRVFSREARWEDTSIFEMEVSASD